MYRNTHPVITLSLKCAKQGDYREALRGLKYEIQRQFINNKFILDSYKLADEYKDEYKKFCQWMKMQYGVTLYNF